jgi:uncharacterized RDD family membrane protein YckC
MEADKTTEADSGSELFKATKDWGEVVEQPEDLLRYRTLLRRAGAAAIDSACIFVLTIALLSALHAAGVVGRYVVILLAVQVLRGLWNVFFVGLTRTTPGKWLFGLRVVVWNDEDGRMGLVRALRRELVNFPTALLYAVMLMLFSAEGTLALYDEAGASYLPVDIALDRVATIVEPAIGWSELVTALFHKRRRAVHDFIAGTVVVKTAIRRPVVTALLFAASVGAFFGYIWLFHRV